MENEEEIVQDSNYDEDLKILCNSLKSNYSEYKKLEKIVSEQKAKVKELFQKSGKTLYEDSDCKISQTSIDKSYLDEYRTINYLKEKGLTQYVHTKEFFDETELLMATSNNEIPLKDLAEFKVEKTETRINIR